MSCVCVLAVAVLVKVLHPHFSHVFIRFVGVVLLYGSSHGCTGRISVLHGIGKDSVAHQPSTDFSDGMIIVGGEYYRVCLHRRSEQASARTCHAYLVGGKTYEQRIPRRSVNDFAHQFSVSPHPGQCQSVDGKHSEVVVEL